MGRRPKVYVDAGYVILGYYPDRVRKRGAVSHTVT